VKTNVGIVMICINVLGRHRNKRSLKERGLDTTGHESPKAIFMLSVRELEGISGDWTHIKGALQPGNTTLRRLRDKDATSPLPTGDCGMQHLSILLGGWIPQDYL